MIAHISLKIKLFYFCSNFFFFCHQSARRQVTALCVEAPLTLQAMGNHCSEQRPGVTKSCTKQNQGKTLSHCTDHQACNTWEEPMGDGWRSGGRRQNATQPVGGPSEGVTAALTTCSHIKRGERWAARGQSSRRGGATAYGGRRGNGTVSEENVLSVLLMRIIKAAGALRLILNRPGNERQGIMLAE